MSIRVLHRKNTANLAGGFVRLFRVSMTILAMTVVALLSALITMRLAIHAGEVEVPDVSNLLLEDAASKVSSAGLNLTVESRFYSTTVPAGRVLSQSPAAGANVRKGWHMRITESMGPQHVPIPDTVGLTEHDAATAIRRASLDLGSLAYLPAPGPPGTVLAQTPPANSEGVDKPEVSLLLSDAGSSAAKVYVMPNLVGMSYSAASATMRDMELRLYATVPQPPAVPTDADAATTGTAAPISPTPVATLPAGVVLSQTPAAGMRVSTADTPRVKMSAAAYSTSAAMPEAVAPVVRQTP